MNMLTADVRLQHSALTRSVGFADVSDRSQVEIVGKDRVQLLHGLCTNDIKSLRTGDGCEAFLTNVQGKTIGYVYVFCEADRLVLDSVAGESATIIRNLDRYVIREDVQFRDRSADWCEFLLSGPDSVALLRSLWSVELPTQSLQHINVSWQGTSLSIRRVPFTGSTSFFLATPRERIDTLIRDLIAARASRCDAAAVEIARIEAGSPLFGQDITIETLPQEVGRNRQAISFTKGCYLGQETVARIDALGHVNRTLCGLRFAGTQLPVPQHDIRIDTKLVARITSVCWSPRLESPLALAYVRRGNHQVGARFSSEWGEAEVVALPVE
jgi:folate-binding protein YgfZ